MIDKAKNIRQKKQQERVEKARKFRASIDAAAKKDEKEE